jgi:hypothetical protein
VFSGSLSGSKMLFIAMVYNSFGPGQSPSPRERHKIKQLLDRQNWVSSLCLV